ncbi:MAG: protein kinase, partial [bacterium]|nr:protein kinase [bacterium]
LSDFVSGKIKRIAGGAYGKSKGIKNTECSGPAQPAGICAADGKLWFPTIRGAVVIDPANKVRNQTQPPVVLESVHADGKPVYTYPQAKPGITIIPAGTKRMDFKYTGLSFIASHRMRFRYKLEKFDNNWVEAGGRRLISYTNIEPGEYVFNIIACNSDGVWNPKETRFAFTLSPLFHQTAWFRITAVLVFAMFSYLLIGFIKKHLRLIAFWERKKYIGSYEIEEQIGSGGMGIVYRVRSLLDKSKTYAMKVLKEEHLLDEVHKKRFKNEAMLVDRIEHPHIVRVHERGESKDHLYIVMELLQGETLGERFRKGGIPSVWQCIHIMYQVADILVNLHMENIIHRDLKPDNIMLIKIGPDGDYVKLLDFGIARGQDFSHLTESGQVLGTLPYMPPEVLSHAEPSIAMDIYSLGVIAYEMTTQRKPFAGVRPIDTMNRILKYTPPEPDPYTADIPHYLNALILRMIAKKVEDRPKAAEVLEILSTFRMETEPHRMP